MSYESNTYYKSGKWNVHCDVCGFRFKSDEVRKRWDGLIVCHDDYERDHPQKFLKVRETTQAVPFVRHQTDDTFIDVCYVYAVAAYAGLAEAGCAQAGLATPSYQFLFDLKNASLG